MQATATRSVVGWVAFAAVALAAIYLFGFVAFTVLCVVIAGVLIRAGWLLSKARERALCWVGAAVLFAVPVFVVLEVAFGYQVTTVF